MNTEKPTSTAAIRSVALALLLGSLLPPAAMALSNQEILRASDRARGNVEGISWSIILTTTGKKTTTLTLDVKARAFDILAVTLEPPKNRGNKVIMLNGNMWFHKPGLSKPVPISRRQRLVGQASYGDIASTNYANDYDSELVSEEQVNGEDSYVFELRSINKRNTYERIKYWVSKERLVGIKAQYFTASGKLFKSAEMEYNNIITVAGQEQRFISSMTIQDELLSRDFTTLTLNDPEVRPLPDHLFNLNLLR